MSKLNEKGLLHAINCAKSKSVHLKEKSHHFSKV